MHKKKPDKVLLSECDLTNMEKQPKRVKYHQTAVWASTVTSLHLIATVFGQGCCRGNTSPASTRTSPLTPGEATFDPRALLQGHGVSSGQRTVKALHWLAIIRPLHTLICLIGILTNWPFGHCLQRFILFTRSFVFVNAAARDIHVPGT